MKSKDFTADELTRIREFLAAWDAATAEWNGHEPGIMEYPEHREYGRQCFLAGSVGIIESEVMQPPAAVAAGN